MTRGQIRFQPVQSRLIVGAKIRHRAVQLQVMSLPLCLGVDRNLLVCFLPHRPPPPTPNLHSAPAIRKQLYQQTSSFPQKRCPSSASNLPAQWVLGHHVGVGVSVCVCGGVALRRLSFVFVHSSWVKKARGGCPESLERASVTMITTTPMTRPTSARASRSGRHLSHAAWSHCFLLHI